nr:hypothetical protein [Tanacetum cinerariifolium]
MNQEQIRQVTARDEKCVPAKERVKISTTNVRLETAMPPKEDTFQVIIDVIKNCYKVSGTKSYEFLLANKKCLVDAEVFRKILDICPRFQGVDFTEVSDDETTLTLLIDLGYKGPLYNHPCMYVDHMHQPWRTLAAIINKYLSKKYTSNDRQRKSRIDILWGLPKSSSITSSLKTNPSPIYSTYTPTKSKMMVLGKESQGKKVTVSLKPVTDEKSDKSDAKHARKQTRSIRVVKKKVSIFADDNIIPEPDITLELGKSMSLTKAGEEEVARKFHATHERNVIKSYPKPARRRSSGIAFRDTSRVSKKMSPDLKKSSRSQSITGGSSEGTDVSLRVPDESTVNLATSSEESEYTNEEEEKNDDDDDKSIDLEMTDDEETNDEFVHEDEEMTNVKDVETENGDEEITDAAKADADKTKEAKDDIKEAEFPPLSFSLSVSLGFGNQFLNLSSNKSIVGNLKDSAYAEINSLLDVQIQQEIPRIQSSLILTVLVSVISEPSVLTPIPKTPSVAPATTLLPPISVSTIPPVPLQSTTPIPTPLITTKASSVTTIPYPLHAIIQRVYVLEKDVQELKEADNTITLRASLKFEIPSVVNAYLRSSLGDALHKRHCHVRPYTQEVLVFSTNLEIQTKHYSLVFRNRKGDEARIKKTCLDDAIACGQEDPEKVLRKRDRDYEDPLVGPNQGKKTKKSITKESEPLKKSSTTKKSSKGKSSAKTSKSSKSITAKEPVKEPIFEMSFDDIEQTINDVANDVNC